MTESNKPGVSTCDLFIYSAKLWSFFSTCRQQIYFNISGRSFIQLVGGLDKFEHTGCTTSNFSEGKQLNSSPLINVIRFCIVTLNLTYSQTAAFAFRSDNKLKAILLSVNSPDSPNSVSNRWEHQLPQHVQCKV